MSHSNYLFDQKNKKEIHLYMQSRKNCAYIDINAQLRFESQFAHNYLPLTWNVNFFKLIFRKNIWFVNNFSFVFFFYFLDWLGCARCCAVEDMVANSMAPLCEYRVHTNLRCKNRCCGFISIYGVRFFLSLCVLFCKK